MEKTSKRKIAILGGAFDPPHRDHLHMAQGVLQYQLADEVWFCPAPDNRYDKSTHAPGLARSRMCQAMIQDNPRLKVCHLELQWGLFRGAYVFLRRLAVNYPQLEFHLVVGTDAWDHMPHWRDPVGFDGTNYNGEALMREFGLILISRAGLAFPPSDDPYFGICRSLQFLGGTVRPMELGNGSSTQVRQELDQEGASLLLIPEVQKIAQAGKWYRSSI